MRAAVVAVVTFILWFWCSPAIAAPDPRAAGHYRQGKAFLDAKDYDRAIVEFEAAYAIDKVASHLFNIAKAYDAKGDFEKAVTFYQRYIDTADPKLDKDRIAQSRVLIVTATRNRDDAIARQQAEIAAAQAAAEQRRQEEETARKQAAAAAHVKNAEAFVKATAWRDAGNEYRAAFDEDGDVAHLLAAAEAYGKVDLVAARDAYRRYIDQAPEGPVTELARGKLGETIKAIEQAEAAERERKRKEDEAQRERDRRLREKPGRPPHRSFKRGWIVVGGAMLVTGLIADLKAPNADNGVLDASDFTGPVLYGLGTLAVLRGVF